MSWLSDAWKDLTNPGWKEKKKANEQNAAALAAQANTEAWQKKLMQDRLDMANAMLLGGSVVDPTTGNRVSVTGALPQAQDWETQFFNYLRSSPDTTYNAQRGQLERGISDAKKSMTSNLNSRGLLGSVLGISKLGDIDFNRARAISGLEGERIDRKGQRLSQGTELSQSILNRALNMGNTASGAATNFNTSIPNMLSNQAYQNSNIAANSGSSIVGDLAAEASRNYLSNIFKKTDGQASSGSSNSGGGVGQNVLLRYITGGFLG